VCDDCSYALRAKSYHEAARQADVAAITTTGIYPGVSNREAPPPSPPNSHQPSGWRVACTPGMPVEEGSLHGGLPGSVVPFAERGLCGAVMAAELIREAGTGPAKGATGAKRKAEKIK
jgi:hypothetical protein